MADEPKDFIFEYLRRMDAKLDRIIEDVGHLKMRMTALEERHARTEIAIGNLELSIAGVNHRIDRMEGRLDRIERRLDLADAPH